MKALILALVVLTVSGACGDAADVSSPRTLDSMLQALANEAGLEITDASVAFERLAQAPAQLRVIDRALQTGPPGVYVMRYSDDTLRQTFHVFVIGDSQPIYVRLSTAPGDDITKEQFDIHGASYEETENSLVLDTPAGTVRLSAQDVTPVGA